MPLFTDFDKFFLHLPPVTRENDYEKFWNSGISALKKVAVDGELKLHSAKSSDTFSLYDGSYSGISKTRINCQLYVPKNIEKPHPVIVIHDYNHPEPYKGFKLDNELAYLFVQLRGHKYIKEQVEPKKTTAKKTQRTPIDKELPGYLAEKILEPESYYLKAVYLDTLRAVDFLRLNRKLNCGSIGIMGKGLGAAAAAFAASYSDRIEALVLDSPLFSFIEESQNESESDAANEINSYIKYNHGKRSLVKRSLSYFDTISFAKEISCDVMMSVGLRDTIAPPQCSFALFNHLLCDKEAQVYPDDGNDSGGEVQFKKAVAWIKNRIK